MSDQDIFVSPTGRVMRRCAYCCEWIEEGEDVLSIFSGVLGKGQKSGLPMAVDVHPNDPNPEEILHPECAVNYLMGE